MPKPRAPEKPVTTIVTDKLVDPDNGPQTKKEVLAYVDGKVKVEGEYDIKGDTMDAKVKRLIAVHPNFRDLYYQEGDKRVTEKTKEKLKKLFGQVRDYIFSLANARLKGIQEKTDTESALPKDSKLIADTKIILSKKGPDSQYNLAGWTGDVHQDDKIDLLDDGRVIKIKGIDYILCKVEHKLGLKKNKGTREYTGYIPADKFDKKYIKAPKRKPKETAYAAGSVTEITDQTFKAEVLGSNLPVALLIYPKGAIQENWNPTFDKLAAKYKGQFKFCKLDGPKYPKLQKKYKAIGYPTIRLFKYGKPIKDTKGMDGAKRTDAKLEEFLKKHAAPLPKTTTTLKSNAGKPELDTSKVFLMGDSLTVAMSKYFSKSYSGYKGAKGTTWMRKQLDTFIKERKSGKHGEITTVVIGGGYNTLTGTYGYDKIIKDFQYMYQQAKEAGLKVVAHTIPDWNYAKIHPILVKRWKNKKWGDRANRSTLKGVYPYKTPAALKAETEKINSWIKSQEGKTADAVVDVYGKGFKWRKDGIHRTKDASKEMATLIKTEAYRKLQKK